MSVLEARIAALARQKATAVSLRDLYRFGHRPIPSVRLQNALFLQRELPIRMAQRIEELKTLPFGLHQSKPIEQVIEWYSSFVDTLTAMPRLADASDEQKFTSAIEAMLQTPDLVVVMLSSAVIDSGALDCSGKGGGSATRSEEQISYMQSALDRFFTARIGLRFLMEHHIESRAAQPEGWSGVIQADFDPADVIQHAVDDATRLCEDEYGTAPRTVVRMAAIEDAPCESRNSRLTYVPSHMHYICVELIKNAMRATTTRHLTDEDDSAPEELPPIVVTAAFGRDALGVRVSDEGGGIPVSEASRVWRYAYTTAKTPLIELDGRSAASGGGGGGGGGAGGGGGGSFPPQALRRGALAGFGMGLPLSRL
jgi:pyruvate dehydrogenase kinase 2/3/4